MSTAQTDRLTGPLSSAAIKVPCRAATTANITLSGTQTIDGVGIVSGDRVLVKNQTDTTKNGIWVASASSWARATDLNGNRDVVNGTMVAVTNGGTANGSTLWQITTPDPITIETSAIVFVHVPTIGPKGDPGDKGDKGDKGDAGGGVPTGGTTNQLLAKASGTNFDDAWISLASLFTQTASANGKITLPGGIILQWGISGDIAGGGTGTVAFTAAFPATVFAIHCTSVRASSPGDGGGFFVEPATITLSGFTIGSALGNTSKFYWFAVGN